MPTSSIQAIRSAVWICAPGGSAAGSSSVADCTSVYRWEGKVESAAEVPVLIKTTAARYPALEQAIRNLHPYEIPEIVAIPISHGLPEYLNWVAAETA